MSGIKKHITVKVSYFDFSFDDVNEAMKFAETAYKSSEDSKHVNVIIEFEKEDGDEV